MLEKIMKFLKIEVNETKFEENPIKKFNGVILDKRENELIIGSSSNKYIQMRILLSERQLLPNMVYPTLYDKKYNSIEFDNISLRDSIIIEFDGELKTDTIVPINSCNKILNIIDLDVKDRN